MPWRVAAERADPEVASAPMLGLPLRLSRSVPVYYGWIVLGCVCCAGFARQGPAVATLSIFVEPMSAEFGWSRAAISGAVSLGGLLAAVASPLLGPFVDRHGARAMLCYAVLATGAATLLLSQTQDLLLFYLLFCLARMNFAGPFDLGIYGAINNWFITRRPSATSIATLAQMAGLTAMPMIAHLAMTAAAEPGAAVDWRAGWIAVGTTVLVIGFLPSFLLLARSPEDLGLEPDGKRSASSNTATPRPPEPEFTRGEAMATPAFWMLLAFTVLCYPVQAGVSLHQAPHLVERGLDPTIAATVVSTFSLISGVSGAFYGAIVRRIGTRASLAMVAVFLAAGSGGMLWIEAAVHAYASAALFGLGIGGLLTVLPIAWADYFGRRSFGAIRGVVLAAQVSAQAAGPLMSGVLRDLSGDYVFSLEVFAAMSAAGVVAALFARAPKPR